MDLVLRPVSEMGMINAKVALERLRAMISDDHTRLLLELILERGDDAALFPLQTDKWLEAVYQLLFCEWLQTPEGFEISADYVGYAGDWDQALHLALMIEHPRYPY